MKSIYILLTIFNSLICCEKCPKIQSIINLSPSGLYFNYSLVVIAKGQYYLIEGKKATEPPGQPKLPVEPSGDMPPGFEDSTINVVVDGLGCARVHYSLLTIKSFPTADKGWKTLYSTLDLLNWTPDTKWSQPMDASEYPMLAKDPFIKMFKEFGSNFKIEHFIHTILYWHQMKTYFIVTKMFSPSNQTEYHYYSATILNPCDQIYLYSRPERIETLGSALKFVIEPLDFCLFLEDPKLIQENIQLERTLVYCIGGQSFQINEVIALFRNGTIRTNLLTDPNHLPSVDRLKHIGGVCHSLAKVNAPKTKSGLDSEGAHLDIGINSTTEDMGKEKVAVKGHYIIIFVLIGSLVVFILVLLVIMLCVRKQQRLANI